MIKEMLGWYIHFNINIHACQMLTSTISLRTGDTLLHGRADPVHSSSNIPAALFDGFTYYGQS